MTETRTVQTDRAPAAIGPYSQGVVHNGILYSSGQIPLDPKSGEMLDGDVSAQADLVLSNLMAVVEASGSSLESILRTTIYLVDMADFLAVNAVYEKHMGSHRPARACVAVKALPKGARVEIDCIAAVS